MLGLLEILSNILLAARLMTAIAPQAKHVDDTKIGEYSYYIAEASRETGIDPYLIAAVMWHESRFTHNLKSPTNDYGLMQVHWQPKVKWLKGLKPEDLFDPRTNIFVGARELADMRRFCRGLRHTKADHDWWGHYKWGVVVQDPKYAQNVLWKHRVLSRSPYPGT